MFISGAIPERSLPDTTREARFVTPNFCSDVSTQTIAPLSGFKLYVWEVRLTLSADVVCTSKTLHYKGINEWHDGSKNWDASYSDEDDYLDTANEVWMPANGKRIYRWLYRIPKVFRSIYDGKLEIINDNGTWTGTRAKCTVYYLVIPDDGA